MFAATVSSVYPSVVLQHDVPEEMGCVQHPLVSVGPSYSDKARELGNLGIGVPTLQNVFSLRERDPHILVVKSFSPSEITFLACEAIDVDIGFIDASMLADE